MNQTRHIRREQRPQKNSKCPATSWKRPLLFRNIILICLIKCIEATLPSLTLIGKRKPPLERQTIADTKPLIGTYQVIVIDPPWPFTSRQGDPSHEISSPYESMSIADMQRMSIPARQTVALDAPELSDHLSSKVVKRNGRLTSVTSGK